MEQLLLGMWNAAASELTIRRPSGQIYKYKGAAILAGSHQVFGVVTVDKEVHVLTGPKSNKAASRRVKFNDAAVYVGSSAL